MSNDLRRLPFLIRLSRKTRRVVYQNLAFGGIFIVAGLILSGFGFFTPFGMKEYSRYAPMLAAFLHIISSFVVVFNSARLVRFGEQMTPYHGAGAEHS
jgi:Cd2+/Zn2+-exporting ATPase